MSRKNSQSFSVDRSRLFSEVERLQVETDQYTQRFEWEKKNLRLMDNGLKAIQEQIDKTKDNIERLTRERDQGQMRKLASQGKTVERQAKVLDKRLNDTLGEIKLQKDEVDRLREEKMRLTEGVRTIKEEMQRNSEEIERLGKEITRLGEEEASLNEQMLREKLEHEKDKSEFYGKLIELDQQYKDKRHSTKAEPRDHIETDTVSVLKNKVLRLIVNNKEKVKLIESYQKSMKAIDDAFNVIKEATGITDIDEIRTTFIKGEEQNYGLLTYVDVLSQEIHNLTAQNEERARRNAQIMEENKAKKQVLLSMPEDQQRSLALSKICTQKQEYVKKFSQQLAKVEPACRDCLVALAAGPTSSGPFDPEGFTLITSNLVEHFSAIDEALGPLLVHLAKKNGKENALKQLLLLDQLPKADSKKQQPAFLPSSEEEVPKGELLDFKKLRQLAQVELRKRDIKPKK